MTKDLIEILQLSQFSLLTGFCFFIRIGAMMAVLPAFGEQSVPVRIRLGATLAFTALAAPLLGPQISEIDLSRRMIVVTFGSEVIIGLFFGLALRFFVFSLQIVGAICAQSTSLSQIFGGSAGVDAQPAIGRILVIAGLALATMSGLHSKALIYILNSYQIVPFGVLVESDVIVRVGVEEVTETFALGFTLSAPFVVASLIYNLTLGVINKAMPQLMVSFVGAPAITAGGLLLMAIAAPVLLSFWVESFRGFLVNPFGPRP